jgi:hypothetical protein
MHYNHQNTLLISWDYPFDCDTMKANRLSWALLNECRYSNYLSSIVTDNTIQYLLFRSALKGQLHEIFDPWFFFLQTTPPRSLIHGLKRFCIWPNIRRKNRQYSNFSGVIVPAKTISVASLTPPKRFQRGHWPRWNFQNFSYKIFSWNYMPEKFVYVSQQCAIFVIRHAMLCMTGIRKAVCGVNVLQCPAKLYWWCKFFWIK